MLVGLGSMELFTSRTITLSRKLLGLHLMLWMQPIALNGNTNHNNAQSSGERRDACKEQEKRDPRHVLPKFMQSRSGGTHASSIQSCFRKEEEQKREHSGA